MTVPAWLAGRPSSLARLMMWRTLLRRSKAARCLGVGLCAAFAAPAMAAAEGWPAAGAPARSLAGHPVALFGVAAAGFVVFASRRRRQLARERASSWLAALPVREPPLEWAGVSALALLCALEWRAVEIASLGRTEAGLEGAVADAARLSGE